jgi:hypothetical protein
MLLGEHISLFYPLFSDSAVVELLEGEEDEDDGAALDTRR